MSEEKIIPFPTDTGSANLPLIKVEAGKLHRLATKGEDALIKAGTDFYTRGGQIVRPVIDEIDASHGRKTRCARLATVSTKTMQDFLSRHARWERYSKRDKKEVRIDPPPNVAEIVLSRDGEWRFRRLIGVITTQTLRPDGSLLVSPGYDAATRLFLVDPPTMPSTMREKPTRADAVAALKFLTTPLSEFPYADAASRSVGISLMMTPVLRGAIPCAPAHFTVAPAAGTGKSYMNDCAAAILLGQPCPVIAASGDDSAEFEKQLVSALRSAQPIISIDNLNGVLKSDLLCQAVERPIVQVRPFGKNSELVPIENRSSIFGTGNNLIVSGDMVRRSLTCTLDANLERPEERKFRGDPFREFCANRGKYVEAILTIVKAYRCAGSPTDVPPLGSFESWSSFVRAPLIWLGQADPVDSMEQIRAKDPEVAELRSVVHTWKEVVGLDKWLFAREIIQTAEDDSLGKLKEALLTIAGVRNEVSARSLGSWLTKNRNRIVDGIKIVGAEDRHTRLFQWCLNQAQRPEAP